MAKRGRPRLSESPTRKFLLHAAAALFRTDGFQKVSVEAICIKAGASKMSFYRHFSDKVHIALTRFEEFVAEEFLWLEQLLEKDIPFTEKMNHVYLRRFETIKKLGKYFLLEFNEIDDATIKQFNTQLANDVAKINVKFLKQGQKLGIISEKIKPKIFLFFIQKRDEMMLDKELIKLCPDFDERMTIVNDFFYFGMQKNKNHKAKENT